MGYVESLMGKNEKILVIARQHWTTLLMSGLINLFIVIVLVVAAILAGNFINSNPNLASVLTIVRAAALIALLYPLARFGWDLLQWSAEQYLVTTHRVIQTEGIINKKTVDSSLEKVNDIVLTQSFLGRILGYGDLEILTGSDVGINLLHRLAAPVKFKTALLDAKAGMHDPDDLLARSAPAPVAGALIKESPHADEDNVLAQIQKLDDLRKAGAINEAEYATAKSKLLAKL